MSLKKKAFSGILWTFIDIFFLKGAAFLAQIVLARMLGPKEFGLIGMISIFVALGTTLVDSGLSASLIRTKTANDLDFSTIFYTNLLISIVIYIVVYLLAPIVSEFYKQPIIVPIIRLYCLSFVISSLTATQVAVLVKELKFKKNSLLNIPGILIGVASGIMLAETGHGVWSIVWMYLLTQVIQSVMLWIFSDWRPSLVFSFEKLKYHFDFGYKLMLSGILNTSFENIYNILIGKFYPVRTLGLYERAYQLNQYPVSTISSIISKVTYPVLSSVQDDKNKVSSVYRRIIQLTFFCAAPLMLIACALAKPVFLFILGPDWLGAVPFFQILCFSSMFYPIQAFNLNVLKVYGRADLFLKLEILKKILVIIALLVSIKFGIYALIWSSVVNAITSLLVNTYYSSKMINYPLHQQLTDLIPTLLTALCASTATYISALYCDTYPIVTQILIGGCLGCFSYGVLNYLFRTKPYTIALSIIKDRKL